MKTPASYTKSLNAGIITEDMYSDCLYSVNKRAKNYRDNAREQRHEFGRRANTWSNDEQKEKYYAEKDFLLSFLKPVCIHKEPAGYERRRIYDYEPDYEKSTRRFVWENCYFDHDLDRQVWFGDVEDRSSPVYRWYLYYVLGDHSFHHPIDEYEADSYPDLEVKEIDELNTFGCEAGQLLSTQFVNKVMLTLCSGGFTFDFSEHKDPVPHIDKIPDFILLPKEEHTTEMFVPPEDKITTICMYDGAEMTVVDFMKKVSRHRGVKDLFIGRAADFGMETDRKTTMSDAIDYLDKTGYLLMTASEAGIGVEKGSYIASGMSDAEYKRSYKKFTVVGKRQITGYYKTEVNEYSIAQYLEWRNTGKL